MVMDLLPGSEKSTSADRMRQLPLVYVLKADPQLRAARTQALLAAGFETEGVASIAGLLDVLQVDRPGCIITTREAKECEAEKVLRLKVEAGVRLPIIVIGHHSSIRDAVQCMRLGANDYLEEPIEPSHLIEAVEAAVASDRERAQREGSAHAARRRLKLLTDREREMVGLVASGMSTKQIALRLQLSHKTVSNHRAHILAKTAAENTAALVQLMMTAQTLESENRSAWQSMAQVA